MLVFDDADAEAAARALAAKKLCNAIQDCISLTRFFIQGAFSTASSPNWFRLSRR
ncbi:MAG: aldehyde dehydrogenase family protein [Bradyrhizobium sp.]|nr:aldehyde dehydrogenase family protein [Bradyrhizobium sp.]MDU3047344.1 aldehyde dehydrogenase family protein [Bradyrhizobium sp.]